MHPPERAVEAAPFDVPGAVAGQQRHDPGVAVVVPTILEHPQLQPLVGRALLAAVPRPAVEQVDLHAAVLHAVPELPQLRRNGTGGDRLGKRAVGMRQPQQVVKVNANQIAGAGGAVYLLGDALRLVEDVGVVPVDEYPGQG